MLSFPFHPSFSSPLDLTLTLALAFTVALTLVLALTLAFVKHSACWAVSQQYVDPSLRTR